MIELRDVFAKKIKDIWGPLIYRIVNKVDNKCYVGQTTRSIILRFISHGSGHIHRLDDPTKLYTAIREFGIDNFYVEILPYIDGLTLDQMEVHYIKEFDSFNSGYNETPGGKSLSSTAIINGNRLGLQTCRDFKYGCFFNPDQHHIVAEMGGYRTGKVNAMKVIKILNELGLEVNEENYNLHRLKVAHNCPKWNRVKLNYPEIL